MSFGFSVSDLITSIELAFKIYRNCFNEAHRADVEYLHFGRDIKGLGESLSFLKDILQNAEEQQPRKPWHSDQTDYLDAGISDTLKEVTGDFRKTLLDCEVLLNDNARFQRSPAGVVTNIIWHTSTEREVIHLRKRVHFHMIKITFIAKPFELQLLSGIRRELQRLRRDVTELKTLIRNYNSRAGRPINGEEADRYFFIPDEIDERFTTALSANSPSSYQDEANMPLKEGFDALIYHVTNSTVNFKPSLARGQNVPEDTHYLNLLKSKWIKEKLQHSESFRAIGHESLWRRYMTEIEDEIADQIIRFEQGELLVPPLGALCQLPDQCFSIWIIETKPQPAAQADQRPDEEKIFETAIYNSDDTLETTLIVFAQSEFNFRLVSTTKELQDDKFHSESEIEVNMNFTRLVPMFAVSPDYSMNNNDNRVFLYGSQGQGRNCFSFQDRQDVADFQRALTTYRVSYETSKVSWHIEFDQIAKSSLSGEARLQLWHLKPLPAMNRSGKSTPTENANTSFVGKFQPPGAKLRRFWTSGTSKIPNSNTVSPFIGSSGDCIALTPPEPPVLLVYTKCDDKYSILHIKMDSKLEVKQQICGSCRKKNSPCSRILITSKPRNLIIRRLGNKHDHQNGRDSLDLACFRHPEHPNFKDLDILRRVKYLSIHFTELSERDEFCKEVKMLEQLRDTDLNDYDRMLKERKFKSNNPRPP